MKYLLTPYTFAQILTGVVAILVAGIVWKRRESRGGWPLFLLFIAVSEWALANGFEAAAVPQDLKILWSKIGYIGSQISPVLLLLFALQYTGRGKRINPLTTGLLFVIPAMIIFLAGTNDTHGLIWVGYSPGPIGTNSLIYRHGPAFWIAMAYIFTVVAATTALLILSAVRSQRIYKKQNNIVVAASLFPWMGSVIYILGLNPFPGLDIISISFLINGLILVWGISSGRLMDIVPIAHELVIGSLTDPILVVDERLRLIDINPAAEKLLSASSDKIIGSTIGDVVGFWKEIEDLFQPERSGQLEITLKDRYLDVRISPLIDHQEKFIGWAVILDDISHRKEIENDLHEVNQQLVFQLDEIRKLQDQLQKQAMRDSLTGVFNRRYLDETLTREIAHATRQGYPLSIIMIDVDHFKKINDSYGHKMGDEVIAAMGHILQSQTRESDCVCRYGGDEFLLVMPEMSQEDAFLRAELWRKDIKAMVFQSNKQVINVSISIGIATYPENGNNIDALLKAADDAMYKAKESGRDRTCISE